MASITGLRDIPIGQTEHLYTGTIDFDSSYPTGGEALDLASNTRIETLIAQSKSGYVFEWDAANQKLLAYRQKDPAAAGGADIALPQVANATDLSAVTGVQFIAIGA
jgi:hypothetical protein